MFELDNVKNEAILRDVLRSSGLELDNTKNAAILRDFLNVWTWQHQKRSNSTRLLHFQSWQHQKRSKSMRRPQVLNLTTSKTKQFYETSSIIELDNIKNETILRDFFNFWTWQHKKQSNSARLPSKWKVECSAYGLVPMRFAIFPLRLSKVMRLPQKSDARWYEVLHLSRKIILTNLQIWCSKMQPLSGMSALTS